MTSIDVVLDEEADVDEPSLAGGVDGAKLFVFEDDIVDDVVDVEPVVAGEDLGLVLVLGVEVFEVVVSNLLSSFLMKFPKY